MKEFFKNKVNNTQLVLLATVWLLLFTFPLLYSNTSIGVNWDFVFKKWKEYTLLLSIFLMNRFILMPLFFLNGRRALYFVLTIFIIVAFSIGFYFLQEYFFENPPPRHLLPPKAIGNHPPNHPRALRLLHPMLVNSIVMSFLLIGFDSGLIFFAKWSKSEQKKLTLEKQSMAHKMAFLKNQVSPHFLMNTLNNIHALVDINTYDAKKAIIELSQIMDYMLHETQSNLVSLKKELDFISSYIQLMRLRLSNDVEVNFNIPERLPDVIIPPLLTISLIENAFKHGVSNVETSFIYISYDISDVYLTFEISNTMHKHSAKNKHSGIGLENTKKRLDLIYESRYNLKIMQMDNMFVVNLTIPL